MRHLITRAAVAALALFGASCSDTAIIAEIPEDAQASAGQAFEVWIVDQSGTQPGSPSGPGGTLHIFDGPTLMGAADGSAQPTERIDLGPLAGGVCASTGKVPVRPHMILFNR